MAVYVDDFYAPFRGMLMCHMVADSSEELLAMADKIGVQRKWLQYPGSFQEHFDICKAKRALAIKAGAVEVSARELAVNCARKRRALAEAARNRQSVGTESDQVQDGLFNG